MYKCQENKKYLTKPILYEILVANLKLLSAMLNSVEAVYCFLVNSGAFVKKETIKPHTVEGKSERFWEFTDEFRKFVLDRNGNLVSC